MKNFTSHIDMSGCVGMREYESMVGARLTRMHPRYLRAVSKAANNGDSLSDARLLLLSFLCRVLQSGCQLPSRIRTKLGNCRTLSVALCCFSRGKCVHSKTHLLSLSRFETEQKNVC